MSARDNIDLFDAVEQQLALGVKDPIEVAERIRRLYDDTWLAGQLMAYADDLIADIARHRMGHYRAAAERERELLLLEDVGEGRREPPRGRRRQRKADLMLASKWVPDEHGGGWKRIGDLTVEDCRAIASHYRMLAQANERKAGLYEDYARQMEKEGAAKLSELTVVPRLAEVA
jgi:hypothetical protein